MPEESKDITRLKGKLYDIMSLTYIKQQEELMHLLACTLKDFLKVTYAGIYIYDSLRKENKLQIFGNDHRSLYFTALLTDSFYLEEMQEKLKIHSVLPFDSFTEEQSANQSEFVIGIKCQGEPCGFILLSDKQNKLTIAYLDQITLALDNLFNMIDCCVNERRIKAQNVTLLDFSSKLHSIYSTKDIFRMVIEQLNQAYPHFSHHLLLSQDYEQDGSLPIKTINYGHKSTELTADTKAFINGEFEIEHHIELNQTTLYTPLSGNQGVYGVIQTTIPMIKKLLDEEISFMKRFSEMIGQSIERTSLYQSSNRLVSDLQMINEASHKLNSNLEKNEIINTVKKKIIKSCYASEVGFIKYSDNIDQNYIINKSSTSFFKNQENNSALQNLYEELDKRDTSMFYGDFTAVHDQFPYQSVMIIPMKVSDFVYGTTIIMHENGYFFSFEKFKLIESLVQHATLALMNTILKEELEQTVITDYLTKLYSRNYLDETVAKHMDLDDQGVFILLDIDNFKQVNDTFGHSVGDKVLIQLANLIKPQIPNAGFAARWGGEEFALYLPHYTLEEGIALTNEIRALAQQIIHPDITVSAGVAFWIATVKDSVKEIFIRADQALYHAKRTGKNKVVSELELRKPSKK